MNAIYIVQCVGQKLKRPALARDLYCSDWFRKARAFVESQGAPWFILSAKHVLLCPDEVVEPAQDLRLLEDALKHQLFDLERSAS